MKKLIKLLFASLLLVVAIAQAGPVKVMKPVLCDETKKVYNELVNGEYAEMPAWGGESEKSKFVLLINKETGTWSLIEFHKDTSCIIGEGEGYRILDFEKKKSVL